MKAGEPHVAVKVMNENNSQIGLQEYEMLQDLVPNRPSDDVRCKFGQCSTTQKLTAPCHVSSGSLPGQIPVFQPLLHCI